MSVSSFSENPGEAGAPVAVARPGIWNSPPAPPFARYGVATLIVALCTAAAAFLQPHAGLSNLTMVYLLGVVITAVGLGRGPAIVSAILGVATFDFVFVPPRFTFEVEDTQYLVTFGVMLTVALVIGTLTARLREQFAEARWRERRTAALYRLSRELVVRSEPEEVLAVAVRRIAEVLEADVAVLRPQEPDGVELLAAEGDLPRSSFDRSAVRSAFENGQITGLDGPADTARLVYLQLEAGLHPHGVMCVRSRVPWNPERHQLLRMLVSHTALALERCRLADEARVARAQADTERTRSALLSSVSHDLRTPLAAITGAATSLSDSTRPLGEAARIDLAQTIADEARRLNRLIGDILEMTRLESGKLDVRREWHSLEELVGAALVRLEATLGARPVRVDLADDLPLVSIDGILFEQVVWNLVENAHKYSPPGVPIDIHAEIRGASLVFEVADRGPGLPAGEVLRVFEKFHRGANAAGIAGAGLGLAICHGIVAAHGGTITVHDRPEGGAVFVVELPLAGEPPAVEGEPDVTPFASHE